jgi:hypothetical protein
MRNLRAILGVGLMTAGAYLATSAMTGLQAQVLAPDEFPDQASDRLIREGDLSEADQARPGSWDHVDELAVDLERLAQDLHDNVHLHLEGHAYFDHMDGHADEIEHLAEHIHKIAHDGGNLQHLRADVIELDEQVHHADDVITQIARRGVLAAHYDGAVRVNRRIVSSMNGILHHLEEDLAELDPTYRNGRYHETRRPGLDQYPPRRPSEDYHDRYPRRGYDRYDHYGHDHGHDHYHRY